MLPIGFLFLYREQLVTNEYCYDREYKNLLVRYSEDGTLEKYVHLIAIQQLMLLIMLTG